MYPFLNIYGCICTHSSVEIIPGNLATMCADPIDKNGGQKPHFDCIVRIKLAFLVANFDLSSNSLPQELICLNFIFRSTEEKRETSKNIACPAAGIEIDRQCNLWLYFSKFFWQNALH